MDPSEKHVTSTRGALASTASTDTQTLFYWDGASKDIPSLQLELCWDWRCAAHPPGAVEATVERLPPGVFGTG